MATFFDPDFADLVAAAADRGRLEKRERDRRAVIEGHAITCPVCDMTSYNPNDVREGYCGNCHEWTGRPDDTS